MALAEPARVPYFSYADRCPEGGPRQLWPYHLYIQCAQVCLNTGGYKNVNRKTVWRVLQLAISIAIVVGLSIAVFALSDRLEQFGVYGYPGVFLFSLLANATIIFPAPSLAILPAAAAVLDPLMVGVLAGAGAALGELTGYAAGYSGRAVIEDQVRYQRMVKWTQKYGLWAVFVLSIVPASLIDLAGIAAGALRMPVHKFLLVCWIGKTIKTILFAIGGGRLLVHFLGR